MEKGTKDGSVTKRKRKRETAKRVLDVLEDKAKQQVECSQQLEHTMKGIYYRLSSIQRILENDTYEKDLNAHYYRWKTEDFINKAIRPHEGIGNCAGAKDLMPSWPATQVYHATVQRDFPGDLPSAVAEALGGANVSFRAAATAAEARVLSREPQETASFGGRAEEAAEAGPSGMQRRRTEPCMCDQREASPKKRLHDRPGGSGSTRSGPGSAHAGRHAPAGPPPGHPLEFTDEELEHAFDEEHVPDVHLAPGERLFMTEYPDLVRDWEPKRHYPMPYTPGQHYSGKFCEPLVFTDEELRHAFDEEKVEDVKLRPGERLFMSDFPSLASPAHSAHDTHPAHARSTASAESSPCTCGGTRVVRRTCPMKKQHSQPLDADSDHDPELDEEVVEDVTLEPNERLFMTEYPDLANIIEPKRHYPLPYTPLQHYSGKFCEPLKFSAEELEHAFDEEEIPDDTAVPPLSLSGTPGPSHQEIPSERTCRCGRKIPNVVCPAIRANVGLPGDICDTYAPTPMGPSHHAGFSPAPGGSATTVAQKHAPRPGEPLVFDDKELETAFDEEKIPDVKLGPEERLFMKEYPEYNRDFEPKRHYPLPYTPMQKYSGKFCDALHFTDEELEHAFDEEPIPEVTLQPNEALFMTDFPALAGGWRPSAGAGAGAAAAPRGKRCCTCGRLISGVVCPSDESPHAPHHAPHHGSDRSLPQKHTPGSGEPQVFSDQELEHAFDEEPVPDVVLHADERVFMKEYPELNKDFEPKRHYPLPYTPGQVYAGTFCEPLSFSDAELEKAFDTDDIPDVHLQPNERLFMLDFPAFAGDWTPSKSAAFVRSTESAARGTPSGPVDPSHSLRCRNCGRMLARVCPMKKALLEQHQADASQGGFARAISPPAAFKSSTGTVSHKPTTRPGEPLVFSDKELENAFVEEKISDVKLGPNERLFMHEYPELCRGLHWGNCGPLPYTPLQKYKGKFCDPLEFTAEELEKAFQTEKVPDVHLGPRERLFMIDFPSLAGDWTPHSEVPSAKTLRSTGITGSAQRCCVCGKLKAH